MMSPFLAYSNTPVARHVIRWLVALALQIAPVAATAQTAAPDDLPSQFGAAGDAHQVWARVTAHRGSPDLTISEAHTRQVATSIRAGAHTLTVAQDSFSPADLGKPIQIPGAGLRGAPLNTVIDLVLARNASVSARQVVLRDPAVTTLDRAPVTLTWGVLFDCAHVRGQGITIGAAGQTAGGIGPSGGPLRATITGCTDSNHITLAVPADTDATQAWLPVTWGTDDSAALNQAVLASLAAHARLLHLPASYYVPTLGSLIGEVIPYGAGHLYAAPIRRPVIPRGAPAPPPPAPGFNAALQLPHLAADRTNPRLVIVGDSLEGMGFNGIADTATTQGQIRQAITLANPGRPIEVVDRTIGSTTWAMLDTNAWDIGGRPWWYAENRPWLGDDATGGYIHDLAPDAVYIGMGNNDGGALSLPRFIDVFATLRSWAKPPDLIIGTHWNKGGAGLSVAYQQGQDYANGLARSFAQVNGYGLLDFHRRGAQMRDGMDPLGMAMRRFPFVPYFTAARFSVPWTAPMMTTGWGVALYNQGGDPAGSFAAAGEYRLRIGANPGNILRLGVDRLTGRLYLEGDITAAYPGMAIRGTGGRPPTEPTRLTTVSIVRGDNRVELGARLFTPADSGVALTVPGAGTAGDYLTCPSGRAPIMRYESATAATLWSDTRFTTPCDAATALTASPQVVLRGDPHVITPESVADDHSGNLYFGMSISNGQLQVDWQVHGMPIYTGPAVTFGGRYQPRITTATGDPGRITISVNNEGGTFVPQFATEVPEYTWPALTDWETNGISADYGDLGPVIYPYGGSGDNHPTTLQANMVIRPVVDAQSWGLPPYTRAR